MAGLNVAGFDSQGNALAGDSSYNPLWGPVVPDLSTLDLPGQFNSFPGGYSNNNAVYAADPVNQVYLDPAVNPTPTGGYMTALAQIVQAAAQGFSTYVKGSPSVAVPAGKTPTGSVGGGIFVNPSGGTNWTVIAVIVAVGLGGIIVLTKYA